MGLSRGASTALGTLALGSGASFSVLSLSEKFSAVLESSDEDSHLGKGDGQVGRDAVGGTGMGWGGGGAWGLTTGPRFPHLLNGVNVSMDLIDLQECGLQRLAQSKCSLNTSCA